jgi:glycosyltransferase involved in cell wall biosynthesis
VGGSIAHVRTVDKTSLVELAVPAAVANTELCFVVTGRNCRSYAAACLDSLLAQRSTCWKGILVDDSSDDGTCDILASYQRQRPDKFELVVNSRRLFKAESFTLALQRLPPTSIVAELDLDDSLRDPCAVDDVLVLHRLFDVVWTQHQTVNHTKREWNTWRSTPLPSGWSRATAARERVWSKDYFPGHMRTFKKYLFDAVADESLLFDGQPLRVAFDMAYYTAIIESVPDSARCFYDKPVYTYNVWDHNDEFKELALARVGIQARHRAWCQSEMDKWFKGLPRRDQLHVTRRWQVQQDGRTIVTHTVSPRNRSDESDVELAFVFRAASPEETKAVLSYCVAVEAAPGV